MNGLLSFVRGTNVDWNDWQDTNNWFGQWPGLAFWSVCLSLFLSPSKTNELPSSSFIFSRASLASHFSSMIDQKIQKQKCNQTMCSIWRKAVTFFIIKLINCRKFQFLTDILYCRCSSEKGIVPSRNVPCVEFPCVGFPWAFFYILSFFLKQGRI